MSQPVETERKAYSTTELLDMLKDFDIEEASEDFDAPWWKFTEKYSVRNAMLIMLQMPEATDVAAYGAWRKAGRQVRKGELGIRILAPAGERTNEETGEVEHRYFKAVAVFDVSQLDAIVES